MIINIEKKHLYIILGALIIFAAISYVQSTGYDTSQQSHSTLYTDIIRGKSGGEVSVQDYLVVKNDDGDPSIRINPESQKIQKYIPGAFTNPTCQGFYNGPPGSINFDNYMEQADCSNGEPQQGLPVYCAYKSLSYNYYEIGWFQNTNTGEPYHFPPDNGACGTYYTSTDCVSHFGCNWNGAICISFNDHEEVPHYDGSCPNSWQDY